MDLLYIVLFLHQTTTTSITTTIMISCISYYSYIKPQRIILLPLYVESCISYYSYIKPQLHSRNSNCFKVVYRTIPTSNHNEGGWLPLGDKVVYRTIPTSNHNQTITNCNMFPLYIVLFLHQTTTYNGDIADNQHVTITFINKK